MSLGVYLERVVLDVSVGSVGTHGIDGGFYEVQQLAGCGFL